jgi:hypothetical protein
VGIADAAAIDIASRMSVAMQVGRCFRCSFSVVPSLQAGVILFILLVNAAVSVAADETAPSKTERMFEWTFHTQGSYVDPFNDVEVDVVFSRARQIWRVPAFWRGGQAWTVRFAPPTPGEYRYRVEVRERTGAVATGQGGRVAITPYQGDNPLLRHGVLSIAENKRYFVHADGTPFFWLGDTWWTGLSGRISWEGFQRLALDRKNKGFTAIQIVVGLVPLEEAPSDPGFCNEGGCVWDPNFERINPAYFDYADRRIQFMLESGLIPVLVGAWNWVLPEMGVEKMQKHWRYIVARYGAYPVIWSVGGEVTDPPERLADRASSLIKTKIIVRGWTDVARYLKAIDPYAHPTTAHEWVQPMDFPLQDASITDFDLIQSGHYEWESIARSVYQLNSRYLRRPRKPVVQGEIGYESHHYRHYEDFQRAAFWTSMLNGASGYTYGADATWGAYTADKPLPAIRLSFLSWEEGMNLPGSYQVGMGAKLLRQFPWWRLEPRPDWLAGGGKTFLEPTPENQSDLLEIGYLWNASDLERFRLPYAAGIPAKLRIIYIPTNLSALMTGIKAPTVVGLERGVRYQAFLWEPALGIQFNLGSVERAPPGPIILSDATEGGAQLEWVRYGQEGSAIQIDASSTAEHTTMLAKGARESNAVAEVRVHSDVQTALLMRYRDINNYVAAVHNPTKRALYLVNRQGGSDSGPLGAISLPQTSAEVQLVFELRGTKGVASIVDGSRTYTTSIVSVGDPVDGLSGIQYQGKADAQVFDGFKLRGSYQLRQERIGQRSLCDARGVHRGDLIGHGWEKFGRGEVLLDAYQAERLPTIGDWVLVLDAITLSSKELATSTCSVSDH